MMHAKKKKNRERERERKGGNEEDRERERERDDTEEKGETARWRGKSPTRRTCRPAWYFTVADLRGPTGAPRRFYNAASYITTLKPLTKDSW